MIPGSNPFKKDRLKDSMLQSNNELGLTEIQPQSSSSSSSNDKVNNGRDASAARSPSKFAPPAPVRRVSAKKASTVKSPVLGDAADDIAEETVPNAEKDSTLSDADRNELDELERQAEPSQNSSSKGRESSESQRSTFVPKSRRTASVPVAIAIPPIAQNPALSGIGAPQINGASTPLPFGMALPTPNIISRDMSTLPYKHSMAGGVTSSGLVKAHQAATDETLVADSNSVETPTRRPSTTGPILCVLGCGTMGRSILAGVLDALEESSSTSTTTQNGEKLLPPSRFIACVRREDAATKLKSDWGDMVTVVRGAEANAKAVLDSDYILLGSKPQVARDILTNADMQASLKGKVLISILAGTTIKSLQSMCPDTKIIRVMPNTPSRIRKGMSVIVSGEGVSDSHLEIVSWIFNQVGKTLVMDEKHIDAATAMCGSGPAFMAVILESMTDGGVMMGIPRAQAEELAAQTMLGTASMVQAGQHPAIIRNNVATPGGCTIGGLLEMEDGKIRSTMARTIQTATNIAAGLGKNS